MRRLREGVTEYHGVYRRYPVENSFHSGVLSTDEDALAIAVDCTHVVCPLDPRTSAVNLDVAEHS